MAQAAVVARPDAAGDQRPVAYVVSRAEAVPSGELRDFLKDRLPDYMVPSLFVELAVLPLSASGKVDRRALPEPALARPELRGMSVAPRDHQELVLVRVWEDLPGVAPIGVRDNFFELGGHSLSAVRLMARIAQELGRELPLTVLFQGATIEQLASRLRREAEPLVPSCLVPIQPGGERRPLFCVHPAGGNVLCYVPLARELGPEQPFYALQSRGMESDEEPLTRIEEMAADYLAALREVQPQGPYQLAGWSFGGLVAYEMTRQPEVEGQEVALLALFDTAAPDAGRESPDEAIFADDALWLADVGDFLARLAGREPVLTHDELGRLAPEEQVAHFVARMQEVDLLPPGTGADQVRRLLRVYKANVRASGSYGGRITLLRAASGGGGERAIAIGRGAEPDAAGPAQEEPTLGWSRLASLPVEVHPVPGDHLTLLASAHVGELAARLRRCLESVSRALPVLDWRA